MTSPPTVRVKSDCAAVDLLAAIFDEDRQVLRFRYGLPSRYWQCPNCDRMFLADKSHSIYCSRRCCNEYAYIPIACYQCERIFYRRVSEVIYRERKGRRRWFCSRSCVGRFCGETYGFIIHPENRKKWDKQGGVSNVTE